MLKDPRSDRFVAHFLDEWLELRNIDFTTPDRQLYPDFDPWLRDSMLEETRSTFRSLLDHDRGVVHLVHSDRVTINQRLADLYAIPGVVGAAFREVTVPDGVPRGGFLTQAAILKVTANGTATSPVLRGAWISHRLLGVEHRPPPPDVPSVEPDARGASTVRQILEKHRADPSCASCHARIDPPGFALESFDAVGRFRDRYRAVDAKGKLAPGLPVDAGGTLPDGRAFSDVASFRKLVAGDRENLARNLVRQLLTYATGMPVGFSDRADVEAVVARAKSRDYGVRSLIEESVLSGAFGRSPR
jgi:hypothetical protein